jgi:outer membrane protein
VPITVKLTGKLVAIFAAVFVLAFAAPAGAAPVATVAYVDMAALMESHPEAATAGQAIKDAAAVAEKEFTEKSANMSEQEKQKLYNELQSQIDAKGLALMSEIQAKVVAAVREYAEQNGISVVIEKGGAIYGALDITAAVGKKITGK